MATLKQRLHRKNSSGSYDIIYLETSASMVLMANGTTVETAVNSKADSNHTHSGYASSSHSHSASSISGGTFTGTVYAGSSYESYSTYCLRNTQLASSDTTPTVNGQICWTYS